MALTLPVIFHDNTQNENGAGHFQLKIVFRDVASADIGEKVIKSNLDSYIASLSNGLPYFDSELFNFDLDKVSGNEAFIREDEKTISITADEDECRIHFTKFNKLSQKIENAGGVIHRIEVVNGMHVKDMFRITLQNANPSDLSSDYYLEQQDEKTGEIIVVYDGWANFADIDYTRQDIINSIPQAKIVSIETMPDYFKSQPTPQPT